jgi:hypothetical protein
MALLAESWQCFLLYYCCIYFILCVFECGPASKRFLVVLIFLTDGQLTIYLISPIPGIVHSHISNSFYTALTTYTGEMQINYNINDSLYQMW